MNYDLQKMFILYIKNTLTPKITEISAIPTCQPLHILSNIIPNAHRAPRNTSATNTYDQVEQSATPNHDNNTYQL